MRRVFLVPTAMLTVACASRPWTPAVSVATWGEDPPHAHEVHLPTSKDALARWQLAPMNPWTPWAKWTLFASLDEIGSYADLPDVEQLDVVYAARNAARMTAASGLPEGTAVILDLRGAASVAFGAELARRSKQPVSLVPTFNNWPHEWGAIPAEEALASLISEDPGPRAGMGPPVFMLDAWRLAYRDDSLDPAIVDNRYVLTQADLPSPEMLKTQGIKRVLYVVESLDDADVEEDDLHHAFQAFGSAGVEIAMVDLEYLSASAHLLDSFQEHRLLVPDRLVVVDDPEFYGRSIGGFGGVQGAPGGTHWSVGGTYHGGGGFHGGGFHGGGAG